MKTKLVLIFVAAAALFSFTVITTQSSDKQQASAQVESKPGSGLASEDKNQWN